VPGTEYLFILAAPVCKGPRVLLELHAFVIHLTIAHPNTVRVSNSRQAVIHRIHGRMAVTVSPRHAADEEAQAEVEVLNSRLEKTSQLTKKIQASLTRLETSGRSVQEAIGPIYNNTQKLQVLGRSRQIFMTRFTL
jgi:hypothetical protein